MLVNSHSYLCTKRYVCQVRLITLPTIYLSMVSEEDTSGAGDRVQNDTEAVEAWRNDVSELLVPGYDALIEQGCTPRCAAAVVQYFDGLHSSAEQKTQEELAHEYDVGSSTISEWHRRLEDNALVLVKHLLIEHRKRFVPRVPKNNLVSFRFDEKASWDTLSSWKR